MTDEEYLVYRAKEAQNHDDCEAKAWLMTAGTLFPKNFMIQFEAYSMHKQNGNTLEAAHTLEIMFRTFPCEEMLWQEVRLILDHLRMDSIDSKEKFRKDLYYSLMPDVQRGLLSAAAERTSDTVEHCRLIILLLQMFPECTAQEGLKLVDTLLIAEQRSKVTSPVNSMRMLLVREILPVVLRSPNVDIPHNILFRLLDKSIEFCVYSVVKPYPLQEEKANQFGGSRDKCLTTETPWHNLSIILEVVGMKLGWDLRHMFKSHDYESQWRVLHNMCCQRQIILEDPTSPLYLQIFYCGVALFLRALCEYISLIDPSLRANGNDENLSAPVVILLEGLRSFSQNPNDRLKPKKQKFDNEAKDDPGFSVSNNVSVAPSVLIQCFYTATRCWDLLHASERIATDFASLCNQLGVDGWFSFQSFQIDILIYKGLHSEAIQWISTLNISNQPNYQEKLPLQAACCYYHIDEYVTACSKIMDIVCFLYEKCPKVTSDLNAVTQFVKPARHLVFMTNGIADVLFFCVKLLITHLKDVALHPNLCNDTLLGHLLVLLQYDLAEEEDMFFKIICLIKQRGGLTYSCFFNYMTNIDILEEIADLSSGGNLTFNLLPNSTLQNSKQRAVTRGINKGAKEELRAAIEKQVSRCDEPLQPIFVQFFLEISVDYVFVWAAPRPNIVFILTDDQDVILGGLTPMTKTRKFFADHGINFANSFTAVPVCCPSRASILTGLYQHNHGVFNNSLSGNCYGQRWRDGLQANSTIATHLKNAANYTTFFAGKYMNQYGIPASTETKFVPPGWDHWTGLVGNSAYYNYSLSVDGRLENHADSVEDYLTDLINTKALTFIEDYNKSDSTKPFFMMLSTPACHAPFMASREHVGTFSNLTAPRTPNFNMTGGSDKHWLLRQTPANLPKNSVNFLDDIFGKRWATLLSVDDMVANIVDALNRKDMLESTYIFFSSDNGYHLGQFSLPIDKRQMYEFDIRVPLLVAGPNVRRGTVKKPVSNVDLAPTFLELAGLSVDELNLDGMSLAPLLFFSHGQNDVVVDRPWRTAVLIEYRGEGLEPDPHRSNCPQYVLGGVSQCFPDCICEDAFNNTYACLRTVTHWQNIVYCGFMDDESFVEVYNLTTDPYQLNNLAYESNEIDRRTDDVTLEVLKTCRGTTCHI